MIYSGATRYVFLFTKIEMKLFGSRASFFPTNPTVEQMLGFLDHDSSSHRIESQTSRLRSAAKAGTKKWLTSMSMAVSTGATETRRPVDDLEGHLLDILLILVKFDVRSRQ